MGAIYEPLIRRAAGLGKAPLQPDPDRYANRFAHCDVLVVGAGPAGTRCSSGGCFEWRACHPVRRAGGARRIPTREWSTEIDGAPAATWLAEAVRELAASPRVTLLPRTVAFGCFAQNFVGLAERITDHVGAPDPNIPRERLWQVRARRVVLATGAIERPVVFPGNDRPGVMLADAARTYVNRYGVRPGARAVALTACDSGYAAALDLKRGGHRDCGGARSAAGCRARAGDLAVSAGATIVATRGRHRVSAVQIGQIGADGT